MTKILIGDVRQLLRELPDNSVDAVVTSPPSNTNSVQGLRSQVERLHADAHLWRTWSAASMAPTLGYAQHFAFFFGLAKGDAVIGLCPLDSEVRPDRNQHGVCFFVGQAPSVKRLSALGGRVLYGDVPTETLSEDLNRLTGNLPDVDPFAVDWHACIAAHPHGVGASSDSNCSIGVDYSSAVSELEFVHDFKAYRKRAAEESQRETMIEKLASIHAAIEDLKRQLASCEDALWEIAGPAKRGRPNAAMRAKKKGTMAELCQIVSEEFGCEASVIRDRCQSRFITRARNAFCLLAYEHTGQSYPAIGIFLGRHHVTVMSSANRAKWVRVTDERYGKQVSACEARFTQATSTDSGS